MPARLMHYWSAPLGCFYRLPANRFFGYAMLTLLAGLSTFVALEVYAILAPYNATSLSFKAIYAWQTGLNFGLCLFLIDALCKGCIDDWGAYQNRTVGRNWSIWFVAYVVAFVVERTLIYQSISLYRPQIYDFLETFPDLRPDFWSSFTYCLPFWFAISFFLIRFAKEQAAKADAKQTLVEGKRGEQVPAGTIRLKIGRTFQYLRCEHISHISVEDHYSRIHMQDGSGYREIFKKVSLKELLAMLPQDRFFQIHRSHAVNIEFVTGFKKSGRSHAVVLKNAGRPLPVSRHRIPHLRPVLEGRILKSAH